MDVLGIPIQALLGQLLLGLINGAFYALLALGLAIIFGLLNVANFVHGAQYMLGAVISWMLLQFAGIGFWPSLIITPLIGFALGAALERSMLSRLYETDPIYGILLTFGVALVVQGVLRAQFGVSGMTYGIPDALSGGWNLGFMFLPKYRAWVVLVALLVCCSTWYAIEKTSLGASVRAATENSAMAEALGINVARLKTMIYGLGAAIAALAGVLAAPIYSVSPLMGADIVIIAFAIVVIGGMGTLLGSTVAGFGLGLVEGASKVFYPQISGMVVFIVMVIILLVRPSGLFGRASA
jgi:branched-chain amino acid transport system permease protein